MSKNSKNEVAKPVKPKNSKNDVAKPVMPKNSKNDVVKPVKPKNSKNDVAKPVMPKNSKNVLVSTGQRTITQSRAREMESVSREIYKDKYGGCSSDYSVKKKFAEFMDRKTGSIGYKEETTHARTFKVNDKVSGSSFEYQSQVKFKEVHSLAPALAPAKSNNHKSSGSKSSSKSHGHF